MLTSYLSHLRSIAPCVVALFACAAHGQQLPPSEDLDAFVATEEAVPTLSEQRGSRPESNTSADDRLESASDDILLAQMMMPGGGGPACESIGAYKTGETKSRVLGRFNDTIKAANWVASKLNSLMTAIAGSKGATCKPYTMVTPNVRYEDWAVGCCPNPNAPVVMENFNRWTGGANFQAGANCEYPIGMSVPLGFVGLGSLSSKIDGFLKDQGIVPLFRLQTDFAAGAAGSWEVNHQVCPQNMQSVNGSGMGQGAGSVQLGLDATTPVPKGSWGGLKWPPWSNKYFIRFTLQGRGTLGVAWYPGSGTAWNPKPNVAVCTQGRVRLFDFIDVDKSACTQPLYLF